MEAQPLPGNRGAVDLTGFGRYLSQQRELRGMSLAEVAAATKIPLGMVQALEAGDAAKLPGRVFIFNFVRSYAQVIGLEPDETVLRLEELEAQQASRAAPAGPLTARRRRLILGLIGGAVVLAVGLALLLLRARFAGRH